jgi:hypothetical protein
MDLVAKTAEFAEKVRNWVHFDNLIAGFQRQLGQVRTAKTRWEKEILEDLKERNMLNAVIQISGARLTAHEEKHSNALTLTRIEELLNDYYSKKPKGTPNETSDILTHIRSHRQYVSKTTLKKN